MAHVPQARLFSWEDVESCSDLDRLSLALDYLPDDALMQALEARRAKGRDDYPVQAMWNAVIAGVVFPTPEHRLATAGTWPQPGADGSLRV
jgi:hypothetical protein